MPSKESKNSTYLRWPEKMKTTVTNHESLLSFFTNKFAMIMMWSRSD